MNIFYLHSNPQICARYHCDVHVVKMILETAQLLSTAHHESGSGTEEMYKPTHRNHPSAIWTRHSFENYLWLYGLFVELLAEYTYRYGKVHKSSRLVNVLATPPDLPVNGFTQPTQAMPEEYKNEDAIAAYRQYYLHKYDTLVRPMRWTKRNAPIFVMYRDALSEEK